MRTLTVIGLFIVIVGAGIYLRVHPPAPRTFTYTVREVMGPADFNVRTFFRRGDGFTGEIVRETRAGRTATRVLYQNPRARARIAVQLEAGTRTTEPVPVEVARSWRKTPGRCSCPGRGELIAAEELRGIKVQHLRTADGETWLAPALGCAELQAKRASMHTELVEVKLESPDRKLYMLDAHTREVGALSASH